MTECLLKSHLIRGDIKMYSLQGKAIIQVAKWKIQTLTSNHTFSFICVCDFVSCDSVGCQLITHDTFH